MKMLRITLEGKSYEVGVEVLNESAPTATAHHAAVASSSTLQPVAATPAAAASVAIPGAGQIVVSPMAGLVFKCLVKPGDVVTLNQVVMVLDAMKMETPVYATGAGTVSVVLVKEGDAVDEGHSLLQIAGAA